MVKSDLPSQKALVSFKVTVCAYKKPVGIRLVLKFNLSSESRITFRTSSNIEIGAEILRQRK